MQHFISSILFGLTLAACASRPPDIASADEPLSVLVVDRASLEAFEAEAASRDGAPVAYLRTEMRFPPFASSSGCDLKTGIEGSKGSLPFRFGAGQRFAPGHVLPSSRWAMSINQFPGRRAVPGERYKMRGPVFSGYAAFALTSAGNRWVRFEARNGIAVEADNADIQVIGPLKMSVDGSEVLISPAGFDREALLDEVAMLTGRENADISFARMTEEC